MVPFSGLESRQWRFFFEKGEPTRKVWYYQLDPGRNLGKTNPLNDEDLKEFVELQAGFADSDKSWTVQVTDLDQESLDLSVRNPHAEEEAPLREPADILAEITALDRESAAVLARVGGLV